MLNMITVINSLYYVKRKMEMNANDVKRRQREENRISMGSSLWPPPKVSMELHVKNREKLLTSLRQHLSDSSRPLHGFVLLQVSLCLHSSSFHFSFFLTIFIQFRSRRVAKSKRVTTPITWSSSGILTLNPPHRFTF